MKTFFMLTSFHLKRILKDRNLILGLIVLPLFIIAFTFFLKSGDLNSNYYISIVSESNYFNEKVLVKLPEFYKRSVKTNLNEEKKKVFDKNIPLLIHIPKDFENSYTLNYISLYGEDRDTVLEEAVNGILINEKLLNNEEVKIGINTRDLKIQEGYVNLENKKKSSVDTGSNLIFILLYYIMFSIIFLGSDYQNIFGNNIRKRSSITNTGDITKKGSLVFTYNILLSFIYILIALGICIYYKNPMEYYLTFSLIIVSFIIYSLGLMLLIIKILKNKKNYILFCLPVIVAIFFLPAISLKFELLSPIKYLSPTHFVDELLTNGDRMENALIIILMGVVLFLSSVLNFKEE